MHQTDPILSMAPSRPQVEGQSKTGPEVRYRKGRVAALAGVAALVVSAALSGNQENKQIQEAARLAQPAGEVAAELQTGAIDPNSVVSVPAITSESTASGEASDLARAGIIPSSARDEVAGIINGQVGSSGQGTGLVLPKSDVNMNKIPGHLK